MDPVLYNILTLYQHWWADHLKNGSSSIYKFWEHWYINRQFVSQIRRNAHEDCEECRKVIADIDKYLKANKIEENFKNGSG